MLIRFFRALAILLLLGFGIVAAYLWYAPAVPAAVEFEILPGANVRAVARELRERGIIVAAEPLVWLMRLAGRDGMIKAGSYEIDKPTRPLALLDILTAGDGTQIAVTIVEGWTFEQMR